jgi:hypothetical protein
MPRPYRFGKVYALLNIVFAILGGCFAASMLWHGYFWAAVVSAAAVPFDCVTAVGLWRKRLYGFYLLCFSFLVGIASNAYGWSQPSDLSLSYHVLFTVILYVSMAIIFTYFYKRRSEFY